MSHSPSRQNIDRYYREERERAAAARAEEQAKASAYAARIVALWNVRAGLKRPPSFYPTIATAVAAGAPWLIYACPACGQVGEFDLRRAERHPEASISSLIP